ncbi:hypothetical protein [Domibacillus tundrae]|uniref:hypothetical protein n=1 Tax=Domibacillus tundrae TaxID=1587527 RepID=UPI001FE009DB|nr:hypothetical protein [Domibacillus tundrae]
MERSTLSKKASHLDFHVIKELFYKTVKQCSRAARPALDKDPKPAPAGRFNDHDRWKNPDHGERAGIKLHLSFTL